MDDQIVVKDTKAADAASYGAVGLRQVILFVGGIAVARGFTNDATVQAIATAAVAITFLYGQVKAWHDRSEKKKLADAAPDRVAVVVK